MDNGMDRRIDEHQSNCGVAWLNRGRSLFPCGARAV